MNEKQVARFLIEAASEGQIDKKISVFVNRLLLRLFSQPALMAFLADASYYKPNSDTVTSDEDDAEEAELEESSEEKNEDDGESEENDSDQPDTDKDEAVVIQLDFKRLPQEVISPLMRLIAAPRQPKIYKFVKDGSARIGVAISVRPSDFPGDEYDYSQ